MFILWVTAMAGKQPPAGGKTVLHSESVIPVERKTPAVTRRMVAAHLPVVSGERFAIRWRCGADIADAAALPLRIQK